MRRTGVNLTVALLMLSFAGCKPDPSKPEYWDKKISDSKGKKEKVKAVEELRASQHMGEAVVPVLLKHLASQKHAEVKASIARTLGEHHLASATDGLIAAIDPAPSDSESRTLNKEIATALGEIGDTKAVPALVKLVRVKDNYTVIAALEALGHLEAAAAFDDVYALAQDENADPFVTRKAVIALGEIGDPKAVPGLIQAMIKERKGVSFYMEASFALYQLGKPAADALVAILNKTDKTAVEWAAKAGIKDVAVYAKAMQIIGDLHDLRAEKALIEALNFKSEYDDIRLIIRMRAADALGRMRSKEAVKPLSTMLTEEESVARRDYVAALVRIGGTEALPKLIESAASGIWDARHESIRGIAMLGDDVAVLEKLEADEPKRFEDECKNDSELPGCSDAQGNAKKHVEAISKYKVRVAAAKTCQSDTACWQKSSTMPTLVFASELHLSWLEPKAPISLRYL